MGYRAVLAAAIVLAQFLAFDQPALALVPGLIRTVAGSGPAGYSGDGGPAIAAKLGFVSAVAADGRGGFYLGDCDNNRIRYVSSAGLITTFAGNGASAPSGDGGPALAAGIGCPWGIAVDSGGNVYFFRFPNFSSASADNVVRKIDSHGYISTVAGGGTVAGTAADAGPASAAQLSYLGGIALDAHGNLFLSDVIGVREVDSTGVIHTMAGTDNSHVAADGGPASAGAVGNGPLIVDGQGDYFIATTTPGLGYVREVDRSGYVFTVTSQVQMWGPAGIAMDGGGNLFFSDHLINQLSPRDSNYRVRKIDPQGVVSTVAGTGTQGNSGDGGAATSAQLMGPGSLSLDLQGNLYIADAVQPTDFVAKEARVRRVESAGVPGPPTYPAPPLGPCLCPGAPSVQYAGGSATFSWTAFADPAGIPLFKYYAPGSYSYGLEITSMAPLNTFNTGADPTRVYAAASQAYGLPNGSTALTVTKTQINLSPTQTFYARAIAWSDWSIQTGTLVPPFFAGTFGPAAPFVAQ